MLFRSLSSHHPCFTSFSLVNIYLYIHLSHPPSSSPPISLLPVCLERARESVLRLPVVLITLSLYLLTLKVKMLSSTGGITTSPRQNKKTHTPTHQDATHTKTHPVFNYSTLALMLQRHHNSEGGFTYQPHPERARYYNSKVLQLPGTTTPRYCNSQVLRLPIYDEMDG